MQNALEKTNTGLNASVALVAVTLAGLTFLPAQILKPEDLQGKDLGSNPELVEKSNEKLAEAQAAFENEDFEAAYDGALAALKIWPDSLEALRVVFRSAGKMNSPRALPAATSLFLHPDCPFEEKVQLLAFIQLAGDSLRFMQLYNLLDEEQRKNPDVLFLKTRFLASRGGAGDARKIIEDYFEEGGDEDRFKALLANMLIMSQDEADRKRGQETIVELMEGQDERAKAVFRFMARVPAGTIFPELFPDDISGWVEGLPEPQPIDKLTALKIELAANKDDEAAQNAILAKAIEQFADSDAELLAAWMTQLGRFDQVLAFVDETRGRESLTLYDHRLRALLAVEGPEAAEAWLETPHEESSEILTVLTRAKLAKAKGDDEAAMTNWETAYGLAESSGDSNQFLAAYQAAIEIGQPEPAVRALLEAAKNPTPAFPPSIRLQRIFGYLHSQNRLEDLLALTQLSLQRERNNLLLLNNFIYISLILDKTEENYVEQARKLVEAQPGILGLRSTLAFALARQGEFGEAADVLTAADADWSSASSADWAIKAIVMEKLGRTKEAEDAQANVKDEQITAPEKEAFAKL